LVDRETVLVALIVLLVAYLAGSLPIGPIVVRLASGKNMLEEHSGRTGGTNAMRIAGFWAGALTALGDLAKGWASVALARALVPDVPLAHAAAGALAVVGHNASIFLIERVDGRVRLRGGAGGATAVGAGVALAPAVAWIILVGPLLLFGIGYASVATLTSGVLMTLVLAAQAVGGATPWAYVAFGVAAEGLMLLALRPNLARLRRGEERLVGWRARASKKPPRLSAPEAEPAGAPSRRAITRRQARP